MQNHIMIKLQTFIITIVCVCFTVSCSDEEDAVTHTLDQSQKQISESYRIPEDSALLYLNEFLNATDDKASRSVNSRVVASITPIKYSQVAAKATRSDVDCEDLVYIANFKEGQGYAILAADKRIEERVIAVTDDGSLSEATVYESMQLANSNDVLVNGYPTTGPGFFTVSETGDEVYMNPNTATLYNESEQDTLVGNYDIEEGNTEFAEYDSVEPQNQVVFSAPKMMTSSLCVSYAVNEVNNYNKNLEQLPPADTSDLINYGGEKPVNKLETHTSDWEITQKVEPILHKFKYWNQREPFNDLYPERHKFLCFGKKRRAFAGCFPLAIAKIMVHFEEPKFFRFNGYTILWESIKSNAFSGEGRKSVATLLWAISNGCRCWYFYNGTFTFPKRATAYMRSMGFTDAHRHSYRFESVTDMLDNGKPLIIFAIPKAQIFKSHSWNIDGYKIYKRTITTRTIIKNEVVEEKERTETREMVHCDFGWKGECNGFYVSGVFNTTDSDVEHDPGVTSDKKYNYNHHIKIITY